VNKFKWGIIGCGYIAKKFAEACRSAEGMEITAVASRSVQKAELFAGAVGAKQYFGSYEEMLKNCSLDAVYIATVNSEHAANADLCLDNNLPVLCEKPFVMNLKDFDCLTAKAKQKNLAIMEAMWSNFLPANVEIKNLVNEGAIGKVSLAYIDFCTIFHNERKELKGRIFNPKLGGGLIFDIGVYNLHCAFSLFGTEYSDIAICGIKGETGVDINASIAFTYPNGVLVNTVTNCRSKGPFSLRICGDKGYILEEGYNGAQEFSICLNDEEPKIIKKPFITNGFEYQIIEFAHIVNSGKLESEYMPWSTSRKVCEVMEKAYKLITED